MALISGSDANAHNTAQNSRSIDKVGEDMAMLFLTFKLLVENVGDTPTFDNGRGSDSIDLTITMI